MDITYFTGIISAALNSASQGDTWSLVVLFLVLILGEFGVPFPLLIEIFLFFVGYQMSNGQPVNLIPLLIVLYLGRIVGASLVYWLAYSLGAPFANWVGKYFKSVQNVQKKINNLKEKLDYKYFFAVAAGRMIPGLMVPISLASGLLKLRYRFFIVCVILSTLMWDGLFIGSGFIFSYGLKR